MTSKLVMVLLLLGCNRLLAFAALAGWKVSGASVVYYTDDAALFSATQMEQTDAPLLR